MYSKLRSNRHYLTGVSGFCLRGFSESHQSFNPAQIMSVSGHKSVSSLSGSSEKISMGKAIGEHINQNNKQVVKKQNTCNASSSFISANHEFQD